MDDRAGSGDACGCPVRRLTLVLVVLANRGGGSPTPWAQSRVARAASEAGDPAAGQAGQVQVTMAWGAWNGPVRAGYPGGASFGSGENRDQVRCGRSCHAGRVLR